MQTRILTALGSLAFSATLFAAPLSVEKVAPDTYVHHGVHKDIDANYGGDICNISFVVGSKGVAVIDTGGSFKVGKELREAIRKVTHLPILYVINTHVHPDHMLGNAAFKQDHPKFVGHLLLAQTLAQRKDTYNRNMPMWLGADAKGTELIPPTLPVVETLELDLGGHVLQLASYPVAHSPDDMSVFDKISKTLWTGDLLFIERTPSIDGDLKGWLGVIQQLDTIKADRVVPGHGPVSPNLHEALSNEQHYLEVLLADIRAAIKNGEDMESTINKAAQSEKTNWVLFDIINRRNVATLYPKLEWE